MIPPTSPDSTRPEVQISDLSADLRFLHSRGLLIPLLMDRSTDAPIVWATNAYADFGFLPRDPITPKCLLGTQGFALRPRAAKALADRSSRTKSHAEVFTPLPVCRRMIDALDLPGDAMALLDATCLEITCGEAPFLSTRYDPATGSIVVPPERFGILDLKLRAAAILATAPRDFPSLALRACRSTYGYEFQGDNLLIARINLFMALLDACPMPPTDAVLREVALVIAANLVQMDGLSGTIPFLPALTDDGQTFLFSADNFLPPPPPPPPPMPRQSLFAFDTDFEPPPPDPRPAAVWTDWKHNRSIHFPTPESQPPRKELAMKFDYVIGNPPYQEDVENEGDRANPIYHKFMDEAYDVAEKVCLITPARFLFNAGQTPKAWNAKMLADPHLKVLEFTQDSSTVFAGTDIKGGVAITYRDARQMIGPIGTFSTFSELNAILHKVLARMPERASLATIVSSQGVFRFSSLVYPEHPEAYEGVGSGTGNKIVSKTFETLPNVFLSAPHTSDTYVEMIGKAERERVSRFIKRKYLEKNEYLGVWKVLVPEANGSGAFGEALSGPMLAPPLLAFTDTFIAIGRFQTQGEAEACFKYIKTKFSRAMLGLLKITQHNTKSTWKYVPLQDFSATSDIDWSEPVAGIDRQLYAKYGLTPEEIAFVETHVREMA